MVNITIQAGHSAVLKGDALDQQKISFTLERETQNTIRYQEETNGNPPAIGTLYLQRWLLGETPPFRLQVTVSEAVSTQELPGRPEHPGATPANSPTKKLLRKASAYPVLIKASYSNHSRICLSDNLFLSLLGRGRSPDLRLVAPSPKFSNPFTPISIKAAGRYQRYWAVVPPSMTSSEPVTNDDSSEAR